MALGVLDYVELAAIAVVSVPIGLLGAQFLIEGDTVLGVGFLAIAAAMVLVKFYLPSPTDLPKEAVQEGTGALASDPDDEEESGRPR